MLREPPGVPLMPVVACPYCGNAVSLPDPWTAPGFTCPHCHSTVAIGAPAPAPPPPESPFETDDVPTRARRVRTEYRGREVGHGTSAFMTILGGSLGCFAALVLVCGGMIGFAVWSVQRAGKRDAEQREAEPAPTKARGKDVGGKEEKRVTKAKYDALETGMSYEEATAVIGFAGEEMSSVEI